MTYYYKYFVLALLTLDVHPTNKIQEVSFDTDGLCFLRTNSCTKGLVQWYRILEGCSSAEHPSPEPPKVIKTVSPFRSTRRFARLAVSRFPWGPFADSER